MKRVSLPIASLALAGISCAAGTSESPVFSRDIAPIVYQNCTICHHAGGDGPFPLVTYSDVQKHARQIADVTARRYMPPWLPELGYGEFQDERRLTDQQIRIIAEWVRAGAPEGSASETPAAPAFAGGWQLGTPDLVLHAGRAFEMPAAGRDRFWTFVFKPDVQGTRYVRAIEIRPGGEQGARNIHHANLLVDRMGSLRGRSDGFPGMDLTISESPFNPAGHFLFWKPGTVPYSEPDGFAWRLDPGNLLILNTHMQPSGKPERVAPTIGLYLTDKPQTRLPILIQLENDRALDIPAGDKDFLVRDDFKLPVDVDVLAIYPHAHYLGHMLEAYATLPDGTRKWLIRIRDWDFNWQAVYRYRAPVFLPAGTVVSMRYYYDNSAANVRNPNSPPRRVESGNQATDEMAHLWLQLLPRGPGDHRRKIQEAMMRHRLEKDPENFSAHLNLGAILMSRLDMQGAEAELKRAVEIDGTRPDAHDMLGAALESLGFVQAGIAQFSLALRADPDYVNARFELANALARAGKLDEAVENFQKVVAAFPQSARIRNEYGELLARAGKFSEALDQFDRALALDPTNEAIRKNRETVRQHIAVR